MNGGAKLFYFAIFKNWQLYFLEIHMMRNFSKYFKACILVSAFLLSFQGFGQATDYITPRYKVTLPEAHIGDLDIDTRLMDSYEPVSDNIRQFYLDSRAFFSENSEADFTSVEILQAAQKYNIGLMAGPMLGDLRADGLSLWLRPSVPTPLLIKVIHPTTSEEKTFHSGTIVPGQEQRITIDGLNSNTQYQYEVYAKQNKIAAGSFTTCSEGDEEGIIRLAFGSGFHKIGLHNPNLIGQIVQRNPHAMLLMGDIAVDDRDNKINMHRSDYLLRDLSKPWQYLAANVPIYASWDDHDYMNNDLSGIPEGFSIADQEALREMWHQNWNNPENTEEGIYFNSRIGSVEVIMLDTRSFRNNAARGEYGAYLGADQLAWLKETLENSTATFKVISSGTMWSDYISNGKDSWGTWDTLAREEIYRFIEKKEIPGVVLISGDRHGARAFSIPRKEGFSFYEFGPASLGGVPGPEAIAKDSSHQLFGYLGKDFIAYGEFTFDSTGEEPRVVFRLIGEKGDILEEHKLKYSQLTP